MKPELETRDFAEAYLDGRLSNSFHQIMRERKKEFEPLYKILYPRRYIFPPGYYGYEHMAFRMALTMHFVQDNSIGYHELKQAQLRVWDNALTPFVRNGSCVYVITKELTEDLLKMTVSGTIHAPDFIWPQESFQVFYPIGTVTEVNSPEVQAVATNFSRYKDLSTGKTMLKFVTPFSDGSCYHYVEEEAKFDIHKLLHNQELFTPCKLVAELGEIDPETLKVSRTTSKLCCLLAIKVLLFMTSRIKEDCQSPAKSHEVKKKDKVSKAMVTEEYFLPYILGRNYSQKKKAFRESRSIEGKSMPFHQRSGHLRKVWFGKGKAESKIILIDSYTAGGG
jgi:hypothetical protein